MNAITIPKSITKKGELVVIPKEEYYFLLQALEIKKTEAEKYVLRLSREAKKIMKRKKLPFLSSLKNLRSQ